MIVRPFRGRLSPAFYPVAAPPLLLVQHAAVALAHRAHRVPLDADWTFWLLPLRRLWSLPSLSSAEATLLSFAVLTSYWALAALSFRRAARSGLGYGLAIFSVLPGLQVGAVLVLSLLPFGHEPPAADPDDAVDSEDAPGANVAHVLQGLFAGIAIIVLAVLLSAVTFGAYGWGLFVMTPFVVGVTTAYLANRQTPLTKGQSALLVMSAAALGAAALILLALEGAVCLILLSPLVLGLAWMGGVVGEGMAASRNEWDTPLRAVALLPAVFAVEAAIPPSAPIETRETIDVAAPAASVWRALTGPEPIAVSPGLVAAAGLAYPLRSRLLGQGVGAERIGYFSTGVSRERVTEWMPGRSLAFRVLSQPPAMEEMSPYRRVHAPHVNGYFTTSETRFRLDNLPGGGTRITLIASSVLKIDPIPYWAPLARWTTRENAARVLEDLKLKAEARV